MKNKYFGLPKNIFFLGLTSFFNDFSSEMVYSVFPAFFVSVLRSGAASLGIVEGVAEAASNILKAYSGNLSDRTQKRKKLVALGYSLSTITRPFYVLVSAVGGVVGLRFLDRIGKGLRDAPRDALISLSIKKEDLGKAFGYHRAMDTVGAIFGPLVAFLILKYFPLRFDIVFITAFFVGVIAIFTLVFIVDITNHIHPSKFGIISSLKQQSHKFKFFILSIFILSAGNIPIAILLLKTESLGLAIASIPLFYMIYNVSFSGFSISGGELSDKFGARKVLMVGYIILIISYMILNYATYTYVLIAGFFVLGIFSALTDGVQRSLASQLSTEDLRGGALGLVSAANGFGALIAGIGGGYLWQNYSPSVALVTASLIVAIGMFLFSLALINGTHIKNKPEFKNFSIGEF